MITCLDCLNISKWQTSNDCIKNSKLLIDTTIKMIDKILNVKEISVNNTMTYFNGIKVVLSLL